MSFGNIFGDLPSVVKIFIVALVILHLIAFGVYLALLWNSGSSNFDFKSFLNKVQQEEKRILKGDKAE